MKKCTKCGISKPLSDYYIRSNGNYRADCKDCVKQTVKRNTNKRKDDIRKYQSEYREKNKERLIEYRKNNERIRQYNKKYHEENKDDINKRHRKTHKEWYKNNYDKVVESGRRRRAKKKAVNENYTKEDEQYTRELFENKCANCGSTDNLCIDHHFPLSKGNALTRKNAVVLCTYCNCSKQDKLPEDFYQPDVLAQIEEVLSINTD